MDIATTHLIAGGLAAGPIWIAATLTALAAQSRVGVHGPAGRLRRLGPTRRPTQPRGVAAAPPQAAPARQAVPVPLPRPVPQDAGRVNADITAELDLGIRRAHTAPTDGGPPWADRATETIQKVVCLPDEAPTQPMARINGVRPTPGAVR